MTLFDNLPIAALVEDKILCMHGGLSPNLKQFQDINKIQRPLGVPDAGLMCDLLWADPATGMAQYIPGVKSKGWGANDRGTSYVFSEKVVEDFLNTHNLDLIVRGYQVMEDGYEFFANRRLVTIFSAPGYMGDFDNDGAMMDVDETLMCSFKKIKP